MTPILKGKKQLTDVSLDDSDAEISDKDFKTAFMIMLCSMKQR